MIKKDKSRVEWFLIEPPWVIHEKEYSELKVLLTYFKKKGWQCAVFVNLCGCYQRHPFIKVLL